MTITALNAADPQSHIAQEKTWPRVVAGVWDEVRYCSDRCRGDARKGATAGKASQPR
ncbi:MAG: DUF2256 domain-containing protein [Dietzia cercidiphylli]